MSTYSQSLKFSWRHFPKTSRNLRSNFQVWYLQSILNANTCVRAFKDLASVCRYSWHDPAERIAFHQQHRNYPKLIYYSIMYIHPWIIVHSLNNYVQNAIMFIMDSLIKVRGYIHAALSNKIRQISFIRYLNWICRKLDNSFVS